MAHIKNISFSRVGKQEGCCCDRCGQYIQNIWTVSYSEGLTMHYGIDCFEKVQKSGINAQGRKMMNKTLKSIQHYTEALENFTGLTEETDESWNNVHQAEWNKNDYWYGRDYSEYREWMINEFFPYRLSECQKELERFKKINFAE